MALTPKQLRQLRKTPVGHEGNRVRTAIQLSGTTQAAVAASLNLVQPYLSNVARGKYDDIGVENARKFADFFGCAIEDLFPAKQEVA